MTLTVDYKGYEHTRYNHESLEDLFHLLFEELCKFCCLHLLSLSSPLGRRHSRCAEVGCII